VLSAPVVVYESDSETLNGTCTNIYTIVSRVHNIYYKQYTIYYELLIVYNIKKNNSLFNL